MARASTRPLEWSEAARRQLQEQVDYVAAQGIAPPDLVLGRVAHASELLERHPHIGTPGRVSGTREWPIKDSPLTHDLSRTADKNPGSRGSAPAEIFPGRVALVVRNLGRSFPLGGKPIPATVNAIELAAADAFTYPS